MFIRLKTTLKYKQNVHEILSYSKSDTNQKIFGVCNKCLFTLNPGIYSEIHKISKYNLKVENCCRCLTCLYFMHLHEQKFPERNHLGQRSICRNLTITNVTIRKKLLGTKIAVSAR